MTPRPDVSIIIPAYGTAQYIAETLASIDAQTYQSHETVIVNDGSPDTPEMEAAIAPFRDRITYIVQENRGISVARNVAIRASKGQFIALLDSDDTWEPDYLKVQVDFLRSNPSVAAVYPNALIVGDHPHAGRTYMDVCPSKGKPTFQRVLNQECNVFVSAMIRREPLERVGLFDPELRSVEDFDLWLRLLAAGERLGYHRQVLVRHRKRRVSLSADPVWMAEHVLEVLDKAAERERVSLQPADWEALEQRRKHFHAVLEVARGKRAFFRRDTAAALAHIERGNGFFRSWRLSVVCALIRTAPGMLLRAYRLRDRLLVGVDTSF